ncbi:unnamed protein product, partial [Mesorhabditis spiculigera]
MRKLLLILFAVSAGATSYRNVFLPQEGPICSDPRYRCEDEDSTCCQTPQGDYGCCPMKNAVCCEDKIHCCPHGTTCDVEEGTCNHASGHRLPLQKKKASQKHDVKLEVECADKKSKCPSGTTCCLMSMGGYGCCPLPKAVCCEDRMHCCPDGTRCDSSGQRCIQDETNHVTPWFTKFPSTPIRRKPGIKFSKDLIEDSSETISG